MKEKKKIIITVILLLSVICVMVGVTLAAFTFVKQGVVENTLSTGTIMLTYTEGKTGIILEDALPISDDTGKMLTGENNVFDFTVTATLGKNTVITYEVTAVKIPITDMEPLEDNEVKLYLERAIDPETTYTEIMAPTNFIPKAEASEVGSPIGSMILDTGTFSNEGVTIHNYRLRMWVDENTEITDTQKKYGIKINVYAKQMEVDDGTSCFVFDSQTGTITGYNDVDVSGKACPKDVVIPSTIKKVAVTTIGQSAFLNKGLTSVVIPDSVTTIEASAFQANQLTSVQTSAKTIGYLAFKNNTNLTTVELLEGVEIIGANAFDGNKTSKISIPSTVTEIGALSFKSSASAIEVVNATGKAWNWCNIFDVLCPPSVPGIDTTDECTCSFVTGKISNITILGPINPNIVAIYQYNQTTGASNFCVTGEESTCQVLNKSRTETYDAGTIVKYKVNDTKELYFHIMYDDGEVLTMQQRENTVSNVAWYADSTDISYGPLTILSALEEETSNWTNVIKQTYTPGVTVFKDNAYTSCIQTYEEDGTVLTPECHENSYEFSEPITSYSRLMTVQEAIDLGAINSNNNRPVWMYNYLENSIDFGGTMNDKKGNQGYWMMNSMRMRSFEESAWIISYFGTLTANLDYGLSTAIDSTSYGGRAVVNVKK